MKVPAVMHLEIHHMDRDTPHRPPGREKTEHQYFRTNTKQRDTTLIIRTTVALYSESENRNMKLVQQTLNSLSSLDLALNIMAPCQSLKKFH